jgi:membrane protease YdiL (CAAX protease family)
MKKHPVLWFYVLAFVISWLGWIPQTLHARGAFPFDSPLFSLLGGAGPTLAAVIVILIFEKKDNLRNLFAPLFQLRASAWWFVFAFGFWFVAAAVALGVGAFFGQAIPALDKFPWINLLPLFVTMLLSNVWEEIGWRGFALPRLQAKYPDLTIAFLMGVLWSLWHLPLMLNPSSPMSGLPWYGELLFSLSLTVIYTWLYLNTRGSLFFVSVFHAMSNTVAFILLEMGVFVSSYIFVVGVTTVTALILLLVYGPQRFARIPGKRQPVDES